MQVKLVALLVAVLVAGSCAEVIGRRQYRRDEGHVVSDSSSSDSSDSEAGSSDIPVASQKDPQDEDQDVDEPLVPRVLPVADGLDGVSLEQNDNEALPPNPKDDLDLDLQDRQGKNKMMYPGQPWESLHKHGVAPAKLPARESDNAHRYRHSIIHPYGDDLHA